jgi:integrase
LILDVTGEKRRYEKVLENLRNSSVSENNKRTIYDFLSDKESEEIGYERLIKYVEYLTLISSWLGKDFQDSDIEDLRRVIKKLRRQQWSEWTKASIKAVLKKFYQWLRGYKEGYPPEVSWIKTTIKTGKRKIIPEDLLTEKEVLKLIEACSSPRDKAIIALLYDVGCRPSELLTMRRKNVQFDEYSAIVTLKGKTGMRRVRAVFSTPYLNQWLSLLPKEPEHPLWPYDRGPGI